MRCAGYVSLLILVAAVVPAVAQAQSATSSTEQTGQKTLAATMGVYVYPTKGQTPEDQSIDEVECYNWGVQQTGTDPFDLAKQAEHTRRVFGQALGAEAIGMAAAADAQAGPVALDLLV